MDERPKSFVELRGVPPEKPREEGDKPRNAASYCAQYGIPIEDIESQLGISKTHTLMLGFCESWVRNPEFRERSLALDTRPMEPRKGDR